MKLARVPLGVLFVVALVSATPPTLAQQGAPRFPEPPRTFVEIPRLPSTGRTVTVPANGDLQAALNAAQPGDTIVLEAGATYTGPFSLPSKPGSDWVTLRSSRLEQGIPPAGTRVTPQHAPEMPKLVAKSAPVLATARGAHHYRFVGLEISPTGGSFLYNLIQIGTDETAPEQVPHHFIFERSYLHGDATAGTRRGIAMNGAHIAVIDSYLADFKEPGADSQALCGWNGPGPFKIENNYIEGAGENVLFGGALPTIPNVVPSDIEIRGNHFAKPLAWKGERWTIKNLAELKNGRRVLIDGNLFEHSWPQAQIGFAIVLTPRSEAPWATVEDVTFSNNVVRYSAHGVNILGRFDRSSTLRASRILIRNNLFDAIDGRLFQILAGPSDLVIEHNTALTRGAVMLVEGPPSTLILRNNLLTLGQGIMGTGTAPGLSTIARYFPGSTITRNVFFGEQVEVQAAKYPAENTFVPLARVGFTGTDSRDWRLRHDSPYHKRGTDGKDVGVDFAELTGALKANTALLLQPKPR